ncbi:MAG: heavy-metal-associated domain-containing protein, partial [Ruminococcus sp.]|nr:heavy-metal-associated domain-containing protein [Ruminococcus sp.]
MEKTYDIRNLCCAHCGSKIEEAINKLGEVESAVLNYQMKSLRVKGELSEELLARMNEIARDIEPDVEIVASAGRKKHAHHHDHDHEHEHHHDEHCDCGHDHEH